MFLKVSKKVELAKIIQTYRNIFVKENSDDSEALRKIIDAQTKLRDIDQEIETSIKRNLGVIVPEQELQENFGKYVESKTEDQIIKKHLMI